VRSVASLAPLGRRPFRLLWIGQSVSAAGDAIVGVAQVFAVLRVGGDATDIGLVIGIQLLTRFVFVLVGGVWADRLRRQWVMLSSDLLRVAVQAALAVTLMTGLARVWQLAAGAGIYGAAQAFFLPACTGLVPEIVPAAQLQQANALISFARNLLSIGGPAAAGLLIAGFGPGPAFGVDAATFAVSAVSLAMLRLPRRNLPARGSFRADLAVGWRELAIRPWYWLNLIAHALCNFAVAGYYVLGPVIAARRLGGAPAWGAISACWAVGAVSGGLLALRVRPRRPLVTSNLAMVLGALPLLALARPLATWEIAVAAALGSAGTIFLNSVWLATMQELIPDQVRSRVNSYDWLISLVVVPAGFAIAGPLAAATGTSFALVCAAAVTAAPCAAVVALRPIRAVRRNAEGKLDDSLGGVWPPGTGQPEPGRVR